MRQPPLNSLKVFSVVAEHESIAKAAQVLHITESAVSRQVKNIEHSLDVELFTRRNRRLFLTNEGFLLLHACKNIFSQLDDVFDKITNKSEGGHLVVSCEPTITMRWLIPSLPRFKRLHPEISVHIYAAGGPIDLTLSKTDLALRRNDFTWDKNYETKEIAPEYTGIVCDSQYWDQYQSGAESFRKLHTKTRKEAWIRWMEAKKVSLESDNDMIFEHFYLSIQAAAAGLGCAVGSLYMCHEDVTSNRLLAPHGFVQDGSAYYLLSDTPIESDGRKRAFYEWIKDEFQSMQNSLK